MNLRKKLAQTILGKSYPIGLPSSLPSGLQFFEMQMPPGWGYQSYLKAYGEIGWLFAVVNIIAQAVAKVDWHLFELNKDGERTEIIRHDLIDLFNKMNPFQTRYQFMYLATMYKMLVGEEFWVLNFDGSKQPKEVWLAPPAYMAVVPHPTKYIDHYEYRRQNFLKTFTVEEIIHIKTPNPYNEYRGLSPAQALTVDLDSERFASRYQLKLFSNDGTPGFLIKFPAADLPPMETRKELMQEWDERYKGFRNRGKTAFLFGGEPSVITMTNRDMDFKELRKFNRDAILGAYHVPRSVIGITEDVNRANAEAGNYTFAMYTIHPELAALREALNKELCPLYADNLYLDFENPIPEDETAQINNAVNLFKAAVITRNDALQMVGMEPLEDELLGNEYFSPPAGGFNLEMPKNFKLLPPIQNKALFNTDEQKEVYWRGYITRVEAYEAPIIKNLQDVFDAQEQEALDNLKNAPSEAYPLFDGTKFKEAYHKAVNATLISLLVDSAKHALELVPPQAPHKAEPPKIPPVVSQRALDWLLTRMGWAADEIGEETAKLLAQALHNGFAAGESISQIAGRISQVYDMSDMRAKRIARTETIAASNIGAREGYKEAGINKTEWYTAIDGRVCDLCGALHNKISLLDEGDTPPAHPNCRCTLLPVIED